MVTTLTPPVVCSTIFYYDHSKKSEEIKNCFQPLTKKEARNLKKDDTVWYHYENLHRNGQAFGYVLKVVTDIVDSVNEKEKRIIFQDGHFTTSSRYFKMYKVKKIFEEKLITLLEKQENAKWKR